MKKYLTLLFIFAMITSAQADTLSKNIDSSCQFDFKQFCLTLNFEKEISRKKSSDFTLEVFKDGNRVALQKKPEIKLWMVMENGHGHGSDPVEMKELAPGKYSVKNVWFLMRGEWEVKGSLNLDGKKSDFSIPVCVGKTPKESSVGKCK